MNFQHKRRIVSFFSPARVDTVQRTSALLIPLLNPWTFSQIHPGDYTTGTATAHDKNGGWEERPGPFQHQGMHVTALSARRRSIKSNDEIFGDQ